MYFAMSNNLGLPVYIAIWILNGVIQSIIWPTLIRILSRALPEKLRVTAGVSMLATTAVGSVISYILSSAIIRFYRLEKVLSFPVDNSRDSLRLVVRSDTRIQPEND